MPYLSQGSVESWETVGVASFYKIVSLADQSMLNDLYLIKQSRPGPKCNRRR